MAVGRRRTTSAGARLTWAVLVVGLAMSLAAAGLRYQAVSARDRDAFRSTAANVQTIVATQLARQDDLLDTLAGMVVAAPTMTNTEFLRWYTTARIAERFPGGIGISYIEKVPEADLAAFGARQDADPVTGLAAAPWILYPSSEAPFYCLTRLGVWEVATVNGFAIPPGLDYCAPVLVPGTISSVPEVIAQATATAGPALVPMADLNPGVLAEFLPVYDTAVVPPTAEERAAHVVGWVAASFDAAQIVELAVGGQDGLAVSVDRTTPTAIEHVASAGEHADGGDSTTLPVSADGTWTVSVRTAPVASSISAPFQSGVVLVAGISITLLLFVLLRVLATSRDRALELVEEKTDELRRQALHDALTGLPNRALILDRATQMLAHQARTGEPVAALFVDLDDFKQVNDSSGHAAGDDYLCAVADRLASLFREADTVGRLGGDEFVILVETDREGVAAEGAAHRVLDALDRGVSIGERDVPVRCSIGVAYGTHRTAEELLDAADHAMYQAKTAGKGRYVVASLDAITSAAPDRPGSAR